MTDWGLACLHAALRDQLFASADSMHLVSSHNFGGSKVILGSKNKSRGWRRQLLILHCAYRKMIAAKMVLDRFLKTRAVKNKFGHPCISTCLVDNAVSLANANQLSLPIDLMCLLVASLTHVYRKYRTFIFGLPCLAKVS